MDIERAILITRDRIENLRRFIPSNSSEVHIAAETLEYLKFIEKMLEKEMKKDE